MRVIASGRASEIFDLRDGRVLRRFKIEGGDPEREALVMRHAEQHGYPVPRVLDVLDDALVLERIDGPTMRDDLRRRPWKLRAHASQLGRLHRRLHEIVAPPVPSAAPAGGRLLHLDFHPQNVILSGSGPMVIDWTNARAGDPALDVALTWLILATSGGLRGRMFARAYLPHFQRDTVRQALPEAAERRLADPMLTERERAVVRRLIRRVSW